MNNNTIHQYNNSEFDIKELQTFELEKIKSGICHDRVRLRIDKKIKPYYHTRDLISYLPPTFQNLYNIGVIKKLELQFDNNTIIGIDFCLDSKSFTQIQNYLETSNSIRFQDGVEQELLFLFAKLIKQIGINNSEISKIIGDEYNLMNICLTIGNLQIQKDGRSSIIELMTYVLELSDVRNKMEVIGTLYEIKSLFNKNKKGLSEYKVICDKSYKIKDNNIVNYGNILFAPNSRTIIIGDVLIKDLHKKSFDETYKSQLSTNKLQYKDLKHMIWLLYQSVKNTIDCSGKIKPFKSINRSKKIGEDLLNNLGIGDGVERNKISYVVGFDIKYIQGLYNILKTTNAEYIPPKN